MKPDTTEKTVNKISRKDALKKGGKYALFTAAAAIVILTPAKGQTASIPPPGGGGSRPSRPPERKDSPWK